MDPKHRNRIAFVRVCAGTFQRGSNYYHVRHDKKFRFSNLTNMEALLRKSLYFVQIRHNVYLMPILYFYFSDLA